MQSSTNRWLARVLHVLAAGIAANSLLGPLVTEVIEYRFSETLINQAIGLDVVALFGAVPVAVLAAFLVRRSHPAGPVLAFIPTTFAAYMAPQYVVGPEYLDLPGNNEQFFLFHLGLFVIAVVGLVLSWASVDRDSLRPATRASDLRRAWVMLGVVAFIGIGRWLPALVELPAGEPTIADFLATPTSYMLIGMLDLGLVVPAGVAAAIGLRRGVGWARTAAYAVIGWFALVPAAVAAMAIVMQLNEDPVASTGLTTMFSVAAFVFIAGAVLLYRPMFRAGSWREDADERVLIHR